MKASNLKICQCDSFNWDFIRDARKQILKARKTLEKTEHLKYSQKEKQEIYTKACKYGIKKLMWNYRYEYHKLDPFAISFHLSKSCDKFFKMLKKEIEETREFMRKKETQTQINLI